MKYFRGLAPAAAVFAAGSAVLAAGVTVAAGETAVATPRAASVTSEAVTSEAVTSEAVISALAASAAGLASSSSLLVHDGICTSPATLRTLAGALSASILAGLHGRAGQHAVTVADAATGISCTYHGGARFDSASIVKVIILAALLRWHQETGRPLSAWEKRTATLMITQSDNDAATDLWDEVGLARLHHFLDLAKMSQTRLGSRGEWGLTQATAHDEMLLLTLLTHPNTVLSSSSRAYELGLMARVIPAQRWGTPAGAPHTVTVHVKNGWLPDSTGWHINSLGAFTRASDAYLIVVLTDDDPSEVYGIDTIQDVARRVHRDLNAAASAETAQFAANVAPKASPPAPSSWPVIPALPVPPALQAAP